MPATIHQPELPSRGRLILSPRTQNALTIGVVTAICVYYFCIMVPYRTHSSCRYYNLLSDAFLSGSLSLLVEPPKEMLALKDPYDPAQNGAYRLHDATLYNGKYYLYFGPVPALLLFIPADVIFGIRLHQDVGVALFLCAGLVSATLLLRFLLDKIKPRVPFWMFILGVLTLGLCNLGPFLLLRPTVYEVAVASGYFFAMTGLYFVVSGLYSPNLIRWRLLLGSLCCGLAVGSRPSYIVFGLALLFAFYGLLERIEFKWRTRDALLSALSLLAPFGICILGVLAYNYVRFGSPSEFGVHYQLAGINPKDYPLFRPDLVISRFSSYLCYGYNLDAQFPFIHVPRGTIFDEPEAGSLLMNPLLFVIAPWLLLVAFRSRGSGEKHFTSLLILLLGFSFSMLFLLCVVAHSLVRYHVDYEGFLLVIAIFAWCDLSQRFINKSLLRSVIMLTGAALIGFGCWVGYAFGHSEVSPRAIFRYYEGNEFASTGKFSEAEIAYRDAACISPSFALAESRLALILAAQGRGAEAAQCFTEAMQKHLATKHAYRNKAYIPLFQMIVVEQPFADYCNLASQMLRHQQTEAALLAVDGLVQALQNAGQGGEAIRGMEDVRRLAVSSNLGDFAAKIEQKLQLYRSNSVSPK